jgi:hypothetical protein
LGVVLSAGGIDEACKTAHSKIDCVLECRDEPLRLPTLHTPG